MKTAMPSGLMSTLQSHAPSLASPVKMKLKPGDSKLMSNQINRTAHAAAPAQAALPIQVEKDPFGKFGSMNWADALGRSMARADMEKAARATLLEETGIAAGEALAKTAGGIGGALLNFAKAHPGASIGGALGLAHGLATGGIGSGLVEGATGAGVGHGIQSGVGAAMEHPELGAKLRAAKDQLMSKIPGGAPAAGSKKTIPGVAPPGGFYPPGFDPGVKKVASMRDELEKIGFGAALAGLAKGAIPAITSFVKANPLKAGLGAASGVGNFIQSRQQGQGVGSSLLSGATGAASAAL